MLGRPSGPISIIERVTYAVKSGSRGAVVDNRPSLAHYEPERVGPACNPSWLAASVVVLVGRPNVGKSTLFNRITRTRRAIVTADRRHHARSSSRSAVTWRGTDFMLRRHRRHVRRDRRSAASNGCGARARRRSRRPTCCCWSSMASEGCVPGDLEIVAKLRAVRIRPILARGQQDRRCAGPRRRRSSSTSWASIRCSEISAEHGDRRRRSAGQIARLRKNRTRQRGHRPGGRRARSRIRRRARGTSRRPRRERRSPSSAGRTPGKSSLVNRLLRESGCSSATCRGRRAMRWTRC